MTSEKIALAVLSSSLLTGFIGAAATGYFVLRSKQAEYINDFYKTVLARRLRAYEDIERLIMNFKMAVADEDMELYHLVFSGSEDDPAGLYGLLTKILSQSLWLSDEMFDLTRDLNLFLFEQRPAGASSWIPFGKRHYKHFGELRTKLERVHAIDMLHLHKVPKFLKSKKPSNAATPLRRPSEEHA